jgi:hypothetical protein
MTVSLPTGWTTSTYGCATCPEDTVPIAPQDIDVVFCYDITGGVPDGTISGNNAGQMNFVTGEPGSESFVAISTNQSGFAASYPLVTAYQAIEATGETLAGITALALPGGRTADFIGQSAGTGRNGHTDERSVYHTLINLNPTYLGNATVMAYFSYDTNVVTLLSFPISNTLYAGTWAKHNDNFYHLTSAPNSIVRWSIAAGGAEVLSTDLSAIIPDDAFVRSMQGTDDYLYIAVRGGGNSNYYRLDATTMALVATYGGMPSELLSTFAVSDDLHLIWARNGINWDFYYFIPSTSTLTLIDTVTGSCSPTTQDQSGQLSMQYNKGYIYISSGAESNGAPNITKIGPLLCPGLDVPIGSIL